MVEKIGGDEAILDGFQMWKVFFTHSLAISSMQLKSGMQGRRLSTGGRLSTGPHYKHRITQNLQFPQYGTLSKYQDLGKNLSTMAMQ